MHRSVQVRDAKICRKSIESGRQPTISNFYNYEGVMIRDEEEAREKEGERDEAMLENGGQSAKRSTRRERSEKWHADVERRARKRAIENERERDRDRESLASATWSVRYIRETHEKQVSNSSIWRLAREKGAGERLSDHWSPAQRNETM